MKYTIKVFANEPDADVDERYAEDGIECDGFAIIGDFDKGSTVAIHGVNNLDLAMSIAGNDQLYAASIIAKAMNESKKILSSSRMNDALGDMLRRFANKEDN